MEPLNPARGRAALIAGAMMYVHSFSVKVKAASLELLMYLEVAVRWAVVHADVQMPVPFCLLDWTFKVSKMPFVPSNYFYLK